MTPRPKPALGIINTDASTKQDVHGDSLTTAECVYVQSRTQSLGRPCYKWGAVQSGQRYTTTIRLLANPCNVICSSVVTAHTLSCDTGLYNLISHDRVLGPVITRLVRRLYQASMRATAAAAAAASAAGAEAGTVRHCPFTWRCKQH